MLLIELGPTVRAQLAFRASVGCQEGVALL